MAGIILRKMGSVLLSFLKGLLQMVLFVFKLALGMIKLVLLLFAMVSRVFLVFLRAGIPN